jgi:peptidoglycan/xylan/chitin deacetylase (PgdA/CDA1 family)
MLSSLGPRAFNWYKRHAAKPVFQRRVDVRPSAPIISFTFDDFPKTALQYAAAILNEHRVKGTFYVSLGLLDKDSPSGPICTKEDVVETFAQGHELGCHTFSHCHSWDTGARQFEMSLRKNREALAEIIPGASFRSFSYPIALPRPSVKRTCAEYFTSCRGGGQTFNAGSTDLNQLSAFFLEKVNGDFEAVREIIDEDKRAKGWLIFATHDVTDRPSQYGCTPEFFGKVVEYAVASGARILPVDEAVDIVRG